MSLPIPSKDLAYSSHFFFSSSESHSHTTRGNKLLSVKVLQLLNNVLINGINHEKNFISTLLPGFNEW
jgi:hypothetical protein